MQKITPFLWFDNQAEEATKFYVSLFKNSKITSTNYIADGSGTNNKVMSTSFELDGQEFMSINGGPGVFNFTGAISFFVNCESQTEVDEFWDKLTRDGEAQQCGWVKDKFGVYWQIIPRILTELLQDPDAAKAQRVTQAMLKMVKIDIPTLKQAAEGK